MDGFKDSTKMKYMMGGDVSAYKSGGTVKKAMGGAMKSVDKDKNPGLSKLPTDVRNKMGYMKKGGVAEKAMGGACAPVKKMRGGMMDEGISTRPTTASGRRMTNEELGMVAGGADTAKKKPKGMGQMTEREGRAAKEAMKKKMPKAMSDLERARMMVTRPLPRKEGGGVPSYSDKPTLGDGFYSRADDGFLPPMGGGMDAKLSKAIGNAKAAMTAAPRAKPTLVDLARNNSQVKPSSGNPLMGGMNRGDIVASKHRGPSMAPAFNDRPMIRRKTGGLSVMPKGKC